jgi:hypothetical protein
MGLRQRLGSPFGSVGNHGLNGPTVPAFDGLKARGGSIPSTSRYRRRITLQGVGEYDFVPLLEKDAH